MNHANSGVEAFSLRVVRRDVGPLEWPYSLVVAVAESGEESRIAIGTRVEMRTLRHRLLIAIRRDRGPLDLLASSLAVVAQKVNGDTRAVAL